MSSQVPTLTGTVRDAGAPAAPAAFEFRSVKKKFDTSTGAKLTAVTDINLKIEAGTFVAIVGPSGCGKSTLLNMASGLMTPSEGLVLRHGEPVRKIDESCGYVTQQNNLLPWRTVAKNVSLALEIRGVPRGERTQRVREMLKTVGLERFSKSMPNQLSGGMQKRAALARTWVYNPDTLLMDEPFGPLDAQMRLTLQQELLEFWERSRKTVLFVTHDIEEAILLADKVVVFSASPGTILQVEDVPFPRPRDLVTLRSEPAFSALWQRIWGAIEQELKGQNV